MSEWRPVPSFPGYEASDAGEIRSWIPWKGVSLPHILRTSLNPDGYQVVRPSRPDGRNITVTVHRMVTEAFFGPRPAGQMVCHWNGQRTDNRIANLRYGTRADNARDSLRHGTHYLASKTECVRGHALTGDNLHVDPRRGTRSCLACRRIRAAERRAA